MAPNVQIRSDVPVRQYDYEDGSLLVADLGPRVAEASIEVLDDVAIVVVEGPDGEEQFELELPEAGVKNTFITNGVLTIEVNHNE